MNLSDNLKKIRKDNNLSQEQLAEKLGVSRQSVSKWESNQAYPEMDKVLQICQMFNLNIDELLNQNLKDIKEKKESKNNINKYMDDFLGFITKTVDMFSSLKFKDKLKCLFEQFIIGILLFIIFLIIGCILSSIISNILNVLPYKIYSILFNLLEGLYVVISIIIGIVILLHIFKTRYLDYYIIVKSNKDESYEADENINNKEAEKDKIYLEKKEKIIIRDPNHSGYKFIKGLLKCVLFFIKTFVFCLAISFLLLLIFLVVCLILSFLFIKTGFLFVGILLVLISSITINLLIIYILYNFIFNKKTKRNISALIFISSVLILSIGIGLSIVGIKDFDYINDFNSKYFIQEEKIVNMNDKLLIDDFYYYLDIEYIETDLDDVKVVCKHSKNYNCDISIYDNKIYTHIYQNDIDLMKQLRQIINDINNKKIINYSDFKVKIYTSKENIDKLQSNIVEYIKNKEQIQRQEEIDYYEDLIQQQSDEIEEKNNKIYELESELIKKETEISELKEKNINNE